MTFYKAEASQDYCIYVPMSVKHAGFTVQNLEEGVSVFCKRKTAVYYLTAKTCQIAGKTMGTDIPGGIHVAFKYVKACHVMVINHFSRYLQK